MNIHSRVQNLALLCVLIVVCAVPSVASAATREDFWVRPTADCTFNGNGKDYGCAASAGALGAWRALASMLFSGTDETAGRIDPGDYVHICGTFLAVDVQQAGTMLNAGAMGVNTATVTYDSDCSGSGGASSGFLNGEGITATGIYTAQRTFFAFKNMTVKNFTSRGANLYNNSVTDVTIDKQISLTDVTISDIRGVGSICADNRGKNITYTRVTVRSCGSDGIWQNGTGFTVVDSNVSRISLDSGNDGDAIQMSGEVDGAFIDHNVLDMTTVDSKHCGIFQGSTDHGSIRVERNTCLRNTTDVTGLGWRFDDLTTLTFTRNYTVGGLFGMNPNLSIAAGNYSIYGNVFESPHERCLSLGGTAAGTAVISNNTCVNPTTWGLMNSNTGGATVSFTNNIVSGGGSLCINKRSANVEHYNVLFGCTAAVGNSDVAGSSDATDILSDPLFFSPTVFRLQSNSPARSAGLVISPCIDIRGLSCNTPPDIGAYRITPDSGVIPFSPLGLRQASP